MIPYWILLGFSSLFALRDATVQPAHRGYQPALVLMALFIILFVGLRYQVGGDWGTYDQLYQDAKYVSLIDALRGKDPGYQLINWLGAQTGMGVWTVNLVCAALFAFGLIQFVRTLPSPALAVTVAIPYLVIVVAMGYTRQAAAIGLVMGILASVRSERWTSAAIKLILAVTLHKSAILIIPLIALSRARGRIPVLLGFGLLTVILAYLFLGGASDSLSRIYFEREYDSSGALIRVLMNILPAIAFLALGRKMPLANRNEYLLWRNFSLAALACAPFLIVSSSSTVVDRVALYLIPLQLFVFSWFPILLSRTFRDNKIVLIGVIFYCSLVMFVWLNFAGHTDSWIPYQFYPFSSPVR